MPGRHEFADEIQFKAAIRRAIVGHTGTGDNKKLGQRGYDALVREFQDKDTVNQLLREMGVGGRDAKRLWGGPAAQEDDTEVLTVIRQGQSGRGRGRNRKQ